jgi:hypothetical protein
VFQVEIFRGHANELAAGELTYADFTCEYPPVSLFILVLLRLLTSAAPKNAAYGVDAPLRRDDPRRPIQDRRKSENPPYLTAMLAARNLLLILLFALTLLPSN